MNEVQINRKWDELSDKKQIEVLRKQLKLCRNSLSMLAHASDLLRLQMQNHAHNNSTGQVLFPAGVFEPQSIGPSTHDPLE